MEGGEHSLTISSLIWFECEGVLKILEQKDELLSNKGVCRTAPATLGLLIMQIYLARKYV